MFIVAVLGERFDDLAVDHALDVGQCAVGGKDQSQKTSHRG